MTTKTNLTITDKLNRLSHNYWWCWQPDATAIFRDLNPERWAALDHNPVLLLSEYTSEALEERCRQLLLTSKINYAYRRWQEYMASESTWGSTHAGVLGHIPVAYFSAEFGVHESLPNYSGGLGVLAGDHLKSASDLGVPLVAVGLFYNEGYFAQQIDEHGWQREVYNPVERLRLPIEPALDSDGKPILVAVQTRGATIHARVWRVNVGRVTLFLLDANIEQNSPEDRRLTARLYGGDSRIRIRQELVLGIGGVKALHAMGMDPHVVHMNEGHSAFASLELIRLRMVEDGMSFDDALREVAASSVFTTHTPVPAGHDRFDYGMIDEHLGPIGDQLGIGTMGVMGLGRVNPQDPHEPFCMTVLAFKCSRRANGVSNLHGVVSRRMWNCLWPGRTEEQVPIGHITNGVHMGTWLAPQMRVLYDRVLPMDWSVRSGEQSAWGGVDNITDGEIWETHQTLKNQLIAFLRSRMVRRAKRLNLSAEEVARCETVLDPQALTIGFARRVAAYKRADLALRDLDNFLEIASGADRPVQFIYAGKSHPADDLGKGILQKIFNLSQDPRFRGKVVVIEDYDMQLARYLIQGVDVWLNNPRRPLEASGTSGQKVVLNGGLNCSILDGWWAEAFDGHNGFAIGKGRVHVNQDMLDNRDAQHLMQTLREEVIPLYYDRNQDDQPVGWIKRMKRSIKTLGWRFNSDRMVMDYVENSYLPAAGQPHVDMQRFS